MIELRHLRYFVAVAEELNFTRAAERLHMAQPPLSTQIKALETELGVQLFERDKRRVHLTQAGRHFLDKARGILASVTAVRDEVRGAAGGDYGQLDLGFTASSMFTVALPAAIRSYRARYPAVALRVTELGSMHQVDALHARALDLGVLRKPHAGLPVGLAIEEWRASPLVAAMPESHALARDKGLHVRELRNEPLIVYPRDAGIGLYWKVQELCSRAGFRPAVMHEARDASTMMGLVASGFGIAIVPDDMRCVRLQGVFFSRLLDKEAVSSLYLGYRSADANPHLQNLLRHLRKTARAR